MKYISGLMDDLNKKFRLICIPYLILLGACMVGYSFFNWYVYLREEVMVIPEWVMLVAGPSVVATLVVVIWLRPRVLLVADRLGKKENGQYAHVVLAIMAVAFPLMLAQHLLVSATGELKRVSKPSEIGKTGYARYYSVAQFAALKQYAQITTSKYSGKRDKENYSIHIAMPLVDDAVLKTIPMPGNSTPAYNKLLPGKVTPQNWLCITYRFTISKRRENSPAVATEMVKYLQQFRELNFSWVTYMERLGINDYGKEYRRLIGDAYNMADTRDLTILKMHYNTFEMRSGFMWGWTISGTLLCSVSFCLLMLFAPWDEERLQAFEDKRR